MECRALADVCEAIIASVYLDAGFAASVELVERFFGSKMAEPGRAKRDAKSELQEWALGRALPVPVYRETGRSGPDHAPVFEIAAIVEGFADTQGSGPSKRVAEQAAASAFLKLIRPEGQK
jgi:ribonuclease-3